MSFWTSGTGSAISGDPKKAFLLEFGVIPNGTCALAKIQNFELIEKTGFDGKPEKYYQIVWKITDGEFTGREVTQKIKVFDGKPEQIDRALNMMKLVMDLTDYVITNADAPNNNDLLKMVGKTLGIKIREWSMPKQDGSGMAEGNFVSEVHGVTGFQQVTGKKAEVVTHHLESALSRNANMKTGIELVDDIPF